MSAKLQRMECNATERARFSVFLEKAFVSQVNPRMFDRNTRLGSTNDVLIRFGSAEPATGI
jgi:hypothetical protein